MNQGAARHSKATSGLLYETPRQAVDTLLRHVTLPKFLWEPAAGKGAIVRVLQEHGHRVIASDLVDYGARGVRGGIDFMASGRPTAVDTIVTNPPYSISDDFVRRGLHLGCHVIVLLRLMALEGVNRSDLIEGHLTRVLVGRERLPMMHRDGWSGARIGSSGAPFAWFFFQPERKTDPGVRLDRVSWRDPSPLDELLS